MKYYLAFLLLFVCSFMHAQSSTGLVMEYNLYDDEIVYKRNNEIIKTPYIKVNENIKVVVSEFNPYITKANIRVDKIDYNQSSYATAADGTQVATSNYMDGVSNLLGGFSMGSSIANSITGIPSARGASSQDVMRLKSEFSNLTANLDQVESKINRAFDKIQLFEKVERSKQLALNDIQTLKVNPNIRPSRVKELLSEEINYAFAKTEGEDIDINDLVDEMKKEKELRSTIDSYIQAKEEYEALSKDWNDFNLDLITSGVNSQDLQLAYILSSSDSIVETIKKNVRKFKRLDVEEIAESYNSVANDLNMSQLRQVYEEIQNNSFSYSFAPIQAEGDEVVIDVEFLRKNEFGQYEDFKKLQQKVPVSGGWKITGSVGLCFGTFQNTNYKYTVLNNTIIAEEQDNFVPVVTSFAHFYRRTHKSVTVGGSFGLGLPILSGNSVQSASFFFGPTAIVGKNQRFLLTAGLMNAKVETLADIYQPGDYFSNPAEFLPISEKYEIGFFIGVSFNVLK